MTGSGIFERHDSEIERY